MQKQGKIAFIEKKIQIQVCEPQVNWNQKILVIYH